MRPSDIILLRNAGLSQTSPTNTHSSPEDVSESNTSDAICEAPQTL
jgi:hypothetical protein